jgi:hypothetical protein
MSIAGSAKRKNGSRRKAQGAMLQPEGARVIEGFPLISVRG